MDNHHLRNNHYQFLPNGVPFLSQEMSFCGLPLPPAIDVDQSLSNVFSLLNLSPPSSPFLPTTPRRRQIGGEGFVQSDFGLNNNHFRINPHHHHHLHNQRYSSFGFDYGFDFDFDHDQKKVLYSSNNAASEIINNQLKFQNQNQNQSHSTGLWSLKELKGRIYGLAKDQNGCRILQSMFERPTMEEVEMVLSEVVDSISDLMKDQFGNYLVQKLVVLCNNHQKLQILFSLIKVPTNIILVCMNPHGTRAVQKLLENLKDPNQVKLVMKALHHGAATLANDPNGHHVIQYCLVNFDSDINKPILTEIADECLKVATDRSGCCVLQACVEHSRGEVRTRLVAEIMANSVHLAEDPFGNYVLQHMLGLHIPEFTLLLVRQLQGNFASLSCNKYGSNVVEKCLKESGEAVSTRIILEIIRSPNSYLLLVDPYANFVIQSALQVSKGFAHECLCGLISKHVSSMRSNLYGKKILERFEKTRT